MTHHTLLQVAPYAHVIAWAVISAAAALGGLAGAIMAARLTRPEKETR